MRYNLIQYFPASLDAFPDLSSPEYVELLTKAPTPPEAAALTLAQIKAALRRAHRRTVDDRAQKIRTVLRAAGRLSLPGALEAGHAAATAATLAVLATLTAQIESLKEQVAAAFERHPQAAIITSLPGMGLVLGARVLAEFGDAPDR